jgi:hypothetical protein
MFRFSWSTFFLYALAAVGTMATVLVAATVSS